MPKPRSRFSRRHLLALCTFLVPLGVLAVLGQSELQREGSQAQAAIDREAKQFLLSAELAINEQFDRQRPSWLKESTDLLASKGPVRTALTLREHTGFAALLDIILLDEQVTLVWPVPPRGGLGLQFWRDAQPTAVEEGVAGPLRCADLLLTLGETEKAAEVLRQLIGLFETASGEERQPGGTRSGELTARFRLATAQHKLGQLAEARSGFELVRKASGRGAPSQLGLHAEAKLAEMGPVEDRVKLLRAIAESHRERDDVADALLTSIAERMWAGVPEDDPQHGEATTLLREEHQRARTCSFAADYEGMVKNDLRRLRQHLRRSTPEPLPELPVDMQIISTLRDATSLLWIREATPAESDEFDGCACVGLHFDLGQLLAPALAPFFGADNSFVLAIDDPDRRPIVAAPAAVPEDYVAPWIEVRGLTLFAYPANAEQKIALAEAAARNRTILMLALFVTAVAGALWLWRSVSREAELAALKVDLVSRVSHELKTPLALIRMYGETLGMGRARDAAQASHFGGIIARESERLTTLIQRILDFSRQQAGTLSYAPEAVDLGGLMRKVCDAYTPHLEARGAILVESLPGGIFARCDASACESAIVNLLENAAKYAIEGDDEHEIELDLTAKDGQAVIEVRDRGRGIPEAERERVFDGFYRASNSGEVRGAGLGLSLVRHFARAHGGEVTVAPRVDGGCVFRLTLPLAAAKDEAPDSDARANARPPSVSKPQLPSPQLPSPQLPSPQPPSRP